MVAGNSEMFLADKPTEKVIKVGPHHKNHATAGTLAFRKEFLKHSGFRPSDKSGEEMHFLLNWTVPLVQLNCHDTIVAMSHDENTVSKNHLFESQSDEYSLEQVFPHTELLNVLREVV